MNIIVHHPKTPEAMRMLQQRVAVVHGEAVLQYIQKLHCPKEQKIQMVHALKKKGSIKA